MERVLNMGGGDYSHTEIIELGMEPWAAGTVTTAVQVTRYPSEQDDQRQNDSRDGRDR